MKNEKQKLHTSCDFKTPSAKKRILVENCGPICLTPQALITRPKDAASILTL